MGDNDVHQLDQIKKENDDDFLLVVGVVSFFGPWLSLASLAAKWNRPHSIEFNVKDRGLCHCVCLLFERSVCVCVCLFTIFLILFGYVHFIL